MTNSLLYLTPVAAIAALLLPFIKLLALENIVKVPMIWSKLPTPFAKEPTYLRREFQVVSIFFVAVLFYCTYLFFPWIFKCICTLAFISGGALSGLAGYIGMSAATQTSARTTNAPAQV